MLERLRRAFFAIDDVIEMLEVQTAHSISHHIE